MREVWRYHAAASGSVARHAKVHTSVAVGGGEAPRELARFAGSNISVLPAAIENVVVPVATTVAPVGITGCAGSGGSDAPGGSDGVGVGVAEADGVAEAPDVAAGDGDAVREAVGVEVGVAVGCAVVAAGVTDATATAVAVGRGVGVAVMRSVSEQAAITHRTSGPMRLRRCALTTKTHPVRCARAHACMHGSRSE